ncbi:KH domain-containing protein [Candidatus Fermentibacterales bacterium]|nr:KH domain-containing protein [Candidatus Fermentibacterales bacterium]
MKDLVEHLARLLVEDQDSVVVDEKTEEDVTVYELKVAESDLGRVIGRDGRIAKAMRTIIRSAAARKGLKATIEIID